MIGWLIIGAGALGGIAVTRWMVKGHGPSGDDPAVRRTRIHHNFTGRGR